MWAEFCEVIELDTGKETKVKRYKMNKKNIGLWIGAFALVLPFLMIMLVMSVVEHKWISYPILYGTMAVSQLCYLTSIAMITDKNKIKN